MQEASEMTLEHHFTRIDVVFLEEEERLIISGLQCKTSNMNSSILDSRQSNQDILVLPGTKARFSPRTGCSARIGFLAATYKPPRGVGCKHFEHCVGFRFGFTHHSHGSETANVHY